MRRMCIRSRLRRTTPEDRDASRTQQGPRARAGPGLQWTAARPGTMGGWCADLTNDRAILRREYAQVTGSRRSASIARWMQGASVRAPVEHCRARWTTSGATAAAEVDRLRAKFCGECKRLRLSETGRTVSGMLRMSWEFRLFRVPPPPAMTASRQYWKRLKHPSIEQCRLLSIAAQTDDYTGATTTPHPPIRCVSSARHSSARACGPTPEARGLRRLYATFICLWSRCQASFLKPWKPRARAHCLQASGIHGLSSTLCGSSGPRSAPWRAPVLPTDILGNERT